MKMFGNIICSLFMLVLLTACGPIYNTEYTFVPPRSNMGKMCIAQCVQSKSMCQQMCDMRNDNCRAQAKMEAHQDYKMYKHERHKEGKEVKKDIGDFDKSYACNTNCNCEPQFHSCYSACGGQVLEKQVCVAFCDKTKTDK
jgi:hypothetical protein